MARRCNLFYVCPFNLVVVLLVASSHGLINKKELIGCLFQNGLCQVGQEWCYDDAIFGRCLPLQSDAYDLSTTLQRGSLDELELAALEAALTQLQRSGHQWLDPVTQCVLQRLVNYFQSGDTNSPDVCLELYNEEEEVLEGIGRGRSNGNGRRRPNQDPLQAPIYLSPKELSSLAGLKDELYLSDDDLNGAPEWGAFEKRKKPEQSSGDVDSERLLMSVLADQQPSRLDRLQQILSSFENNRRPFYDPTAIELINSEEEEEEDLNLPPLGATVYADPKFERQERLDVKKPGPWFSVNNFAFENDAAAAAAAADGGVWLETSDDDEGGNAALEVAAAGPDADYLFDVIEDVPTSRDFRKKPLVMGNAGVEDLHRLGHGDTVQRLLQKMSEEQQEKEDQEKEDRIMPEGAVALNLKKVDDEVKSAGWQLPDPELTPNKVEKLVDEEVETRAVPGKIQSSEKLPPSTPSAPPDREIVEASYAFIIIKGEFESWEQGAQLVMTLSQLLQVSADTFTDVGVQGNQVTFRVMPNSKGLNPSTVAAKADELRYKIRQLSGLEVDVTGIGDQTRVSSILYWGQENQQMLLTLGLCLLAATVLVAAVVVFLLRNRYVARQKLKDLTQSADSEAPRDYQDLCRARMATKSSATAETTKDSKMPHALLSRDSESSRSSTSSWCEEPVLTNMDISTGHMVLSYMEDHLRNKDRLDQEWQALCAYEAEPSTSVLIASSEENKGKNRCLDVLPYDHSRVVLNALSNANSSDYINASAIADHDPRHPAYIAAQAPVAESTADFWQMVWEQGSVVLVLLTRLNENGQQLCHNYWPEEGSQLYHIYEVHLVSEHIWCDDYLVRSFYLKNVRTGETRTVTQFHFQSWPENGVPSSTKALLEFRRKVNKSYRGRSCPIVVHCSDGAGRTGTYCLIDMVLHRMAKGAREIDIAATLEHLRDQRPQAVRTKQQFEFVLTAVAEEVHAILRALPQ